MNAPRPVRVLHTISGLGGGGLERWLADIIRMSRPTEVEHNVFVLYPDLGGSPVYDDALRLLGALDAAQAGFGTRVLAALTKRARAYKTSLYGPISFASRSLICLLALPRAIRLFRQVRPHVIHAHSAPDLLLGLVLKALFGCPLVHTVPCLFSQMRVEGLSWLPGFYRRAHRRIDIFSTGESRTELIAAGVPAGKILYDLGGVDLAATPHADERRQDWSREAILRRLNLPDDTLLALSAGRLHPSKGHRYAVDVLAALGAEIPRLHLLIIGEGDERPALAERARTLGVEDRVHLMGFIRSPRQVFEAADIYLRTTLFEPENLSFYESMAAGLPAVGFDTGWPDLIAKVGHGRIVATKDVPAFAAAVREILETADRGSGLGRRARDYAARHLDVRSSVNRLTETYARLASDYASRRD